MSVTSNTYLPRDAHQPRGRRPWCATCDTDRHLLADAVTTLNPQQDTLAVAVSCARCGGSRVLATTAALLAAIRTPAENDRAANLTCQPAPNN
ncbi:hypothetical protein [Pseudarthrobacter sp. MM222]|uniref:hypothetical protein n=1 Tax=Pseudarthrobacter sp. MM222 TaxID=3018929 RepID=UPI00221EB04B|nr:hypothetical protein [Pseudarthrobacter sp. MM222]